MDGLAQFEETHKNREHIRRYRINHNGYTALFEIDTDRLCVRGHKWRDLSAFGKRKFENLLFLEHPTEKIAFKYL